MKICSQEIHGCMFSVVIVQIFTWTLVSLLFFNRGMSNLMMNERIADIENITLVNRTESQLNYSVIKGYSAGVVILIIAVVMMIMGPIFMIVVVIERCYRKRRFHKLPQEDPPPNYEDVVMEEMAPRYSTLFLNSGNGESSPT